MKKITLIFTIFLLSTSATQGAAALEGHSYEGAVNFPRAEYQAYMDRIKELNPEIHAKLEHYKGVFHEPAFLKAADLKPTVLIPSQKSHWQPMMVLPSLISDEELERYLASYKALTKRLIPGEYDFSDAEYQHYMRLISKIDLTMYKNLLEFEWRTGKRNLLKRDSLSERVFLYNRGLPAEVYIKSMLGITEEEQKKHLADLFKKAAEEEAAEEAELPESKAARYDEKPRDEYEEYMKLIAKISPSVYEKFKEYEKSPGHYPKIINLSPYCTLDTLDGIRILPGAMIIPPHESNKWNPLIIMESIYGLSEEEKIENLTHIIKKFCEVVNAYRVHTAPPFPHDEYLEYMGIIKELDTSVYENLITCEKKLRKPCVLKGEKYEIIPPSDETHGYPIILLGQNFIKHQSKKTYLDRVIQVYKQVLPMTHEERTKVLGIIKNLAPELYTELVTLDPTGKNHIRRGNDTGITPSSKDGLPLFTVSYSDAMELPEDQLRFIIGHELSHYVQDDFYEVPPTHKAMRDNEILLLLYVSRQKISGQLPFEETFKKARSRAKEYGADAGSVMRFGINIDAAIAYLQNRMMLLEKSYEIAKQPLPTTFTTTHPLYKDRIEHLKSLQDEDEVKRQKASGQKPAPIDWKALIEEHKKNRKQTLEEDF